MAIGRKEKGSGKNAILRHLEAELERGSYGESGKVAGTGPVPCNALLSVRPAPSYPLCGSSDEVLNDVFSLESASVFDPESAE